MILIIISTLEVYMYHFPSQKLTVNKKGKGGILTPFSPISDYATGRDHPNSGTEIIYKQDFNTLMFLKKL